MVATLLFMSDDDQRLNAPPSTPINAIEAQKDALAAQQQAEAAQRTAIEMQAAERGVEIPKNDIEHLRTLAAGVKAADDKIIEHARKNDRS